MKRIVSLILSIVMVFTLLAVNVNAAASEKLPKLKAGDMFFAEIDYQSRKLTGRVSTESKDLNYPMYSCMIKEDGTISLSLWVSSEGYIHSLVFFDTNTFEPASDLVIPSKIKGYTVTEIAHVSGYDNGICCAGVKKIVIPETVTRINGGAFLNAFFLEEVEFAGKSQLKEIGSYAFMDCRHLKSITIPASVEIIGDFAFYNSAEANRRDDSEYYFDGHLGGFFYATDAIVTAFDNIVTTEKGIISYDIGNPDLIFDNLYSLTSVKYEKGSKIKHIGEGVFARQPNLALLDSLPENLETLHVFAFADGSEATDHTKISDINKLGVEFVSGDAEVDAEYNDYELIEAARGKSKSDKKTDTKTDSKSDKKTDSKPAVKPAGENNMPAIKSVRSNLTCTIDVSWHDVGAPYYYVYIAKKGSNNYTKCGIFKGTSATITTFGKGKKLGCGSTYQIRVLRSDYKGELSTALGECVPVSVTVK